jgi:energy-converting hydrogenase A subunit M
LKAPFLFLLHSKLQSQYDKVLSNLRDKQLRLNYLSSFFETTKKKIEAAQQKIMECEKKLIDDEARSSFNPFMSLLSFLKSSEILLNFARLIY